MRNRPLRLRLFWHAQRNDDFVTPWIIPDPQTRDEDYDQIRDFTVLLSGSPLANTYPPKGVTRSSWSVYPNPATNYFILTQLDAPQEVQLVNSIGQIVKQTLVRPELDGTGQIEVGNLPSGLYLVRLSKSNTTRSIIIKK